MQNYRDRVEALARLRNGEPIFNASTQHAAIIVECMFAHAHERMAILSGKLNPRVYGGERVMAQARLFLAEPSNRLRILLEAAAPSDLTDHPFIREFGTHPNVETRTIQPSLKDTFDFHFLVMDGDSYRFESDKSTHEAIAAFGDTGGGTNLERIFETLWLASNTEAVPQRQRETAG